jgi:soluble lytic murein transglycosylase-like protein
MSLSAKFGLLVGLLTISASALGADLAVLHNGFSIRHQRRDVQGTITRLYLSNDASSYVDVPNEQIEHFEKDFSAPSDPANGSGNLDEVVNSISGRHHLDPDLVNSVIHAESGFNPRAVSPKGAQGLMQLMPGTATRLGVTNPFDPQANVDGGSRYLRDLLEHYHFDMAKALAAYNAGPQRVEQYHGVPPYYETRAYVARVIRDFNRKKLAERQTAKPASRSKSKTRSAASQTLPKPTYLSPQASR